jgi:hypothetical protein
MPELKQIKGFGLIVTPPVAQNDMGRYSLQSISQVLTRDDLRTRVTRD